MFTLKNLRTEEYGEELRLITDFCVDGIENPFDEKTIWVSVNKDNGDMLSSKVYDPFVLVTYIMGMYFGQDVKIEGNVSEKLYHNIKNYLGIIFYNFAPNKLSKIELKVNGFDVVEKSDIHLIGTGISCGVDSLSTIYDNYVLEKSINYRINSLFLVNCGTHGDYEEKETMERYLKRVKNAKNAGKELGLPVYLVNSNFHAFTHKYGEQKIGYLAIYSCVLALQKYVHRYLTSSNLSYDEVAEFSNNSKDFDIAEYCEPYMPHLISTENFELVIDGCQYTRAEKTERLADWDFAQKHLNVCVRGDESGGNCCACNKCMWTLMPLESIGKLEKFSAVFNFDIYRKNVRPWKYRFVYDYGKDAMETSIVRYVKKHRLPMPGKFTSFCYMFPREMIYRVKRKLFGIE